MPLTAHETWFTTVRPPFDWGFLAQPWTLAAVGAAALWGLGWYLIGRRRDQPELATLRPLGRLAPLIPRLLGIHAGVSLLAQAAAGTYLAPGLTLPDTGWGAALGVVEGLVGVWLITGFRIRAAALVLMAAGPLGMAGYGVLPILERIDLLGVAAFLLVLPPGDEPAGLVAATPADVGRAAFGLRLLVGGSLVVLAFSEKLARPELALAFLDRYPFFDVLRAVGLDTSAEAFVRIAGATELAFGLMIVSGVLPQLTVLAAGVPFNATLFFLGSSELIGHLPVYGAMLALLVYGSTSTFYRWMRWWPPGWGRQPATDPEPSPSR